MCQAKVYLDDQELARDVIWLEIVPEGVRFATFFEEPHLVQGRVQRIDFLNHRVFIESQEANHGRNHEAAHVAPALD